MKHLILTPTEKTEFIQYIAQPCGDGFILPIYTPEDDVYAAQCKLGTKFCAIFLLKGDRREAIFRHADRIREAVYRTICAGSHVLVMADESDRDLLDWYRREISFYTVYERTFSLNKFCSVMHWLALFFFKNLPRSGMYLENNVGLIEHDYYTCPDCGRTFCFPGTLYLATSDKYDQRYCRSFNPYEDKFIQAIMMIKQQPSAKVSVAQFDDSLFLQLRGHLRRSIDNESKDNPFNYLAQPIVTADFSDRVPFVCPHCMSWVATVNRSLQTVEGLDPSLKQVRPSLADAVLVDLEPNFIRTILGPDFYKDTQKDKERHENL